MARTRVRTAVSPLRRRFAPIEAPRPRVDDIVAAERPSDLDPERIRLREAHEGRTRWGDFVAELEWGYASGDADPTDGVTRRFTMDPNHNVGLVLYPLSAFRAANAAALRVYETIRRDGTQRGVVDTMQTRAELYEFLDYHSYEQKLDELFAKDKA